MRFSYPVIIRPQKFKGYIVRFPDIEEAITQGDTLDECLFNASQVLTLVLEHRLEENLPIPDPSQVEGAHWVSPDAEAQAAIILRQARGD